MASRTIVPLTYPVEHNRVRHDRLEIRPAKRRDAGRLVGATDAERGRSFLALLSGVPLGVIYALHHEDLDRAIAVADAFIDRIA